MQTVVKSYGRATMTCKQIIMVSSLASYPENAVYDCFIVLGMRLQLVSPVTPVQATCLTVCVLVVHLFFFVYFSASPEKEHEGLFLGCNHHFALLTLQT